MHLTARRGNNSISVRKAALKPCSLAARVINRSGTAFLRLRGLLTAEVFYFLLKGVTECSDN